MSSPLFIWLLIDPVSFLGSPLLHLRKPKTMVIRSCWALLGQAPLAWQSFHCSVSSSITMALSILWPELSHFPPEICFPAINSKRLFIQTTCMQLSQAYSHAHVKLYCLLTCTYSCVFWQWRIFGFESRTT